MSWRGNIFYQKIINFLLPPCCLLCHTPVSQAGIICADCFKKFEFIIEPYCKSCGRPFISSDEAGCEQLCSHCLISPALWREGRSAFMYNDAIKKLILSLKYADQFHAIRFLAYYMYQNSQSLLECADYIISVPLHIKRLRERKYNQSALLARQLKYISRSKGVFSPCMLRRIKNTECLGHYNYTQRVDILQNAFVVDKSYAKIVVNKNILLVDDVMTTGSTLSECCKVLLNAGVARVDIVVAAKVYSEVSLKN